MFSFVSNLHLYSKIAIAFVASICVWYFTAYRFVDRTQDNWIKTIESDGAGYYVYLPSIFIYADYNHTYLNSVELQERYKGRVKPYINKTKDGITYSKYYVGTSILILPFFLIAIILSFLFGFPVDGFSMPFQLMVFLAALSYMLASLCLISQILKKLGISNIATGISLVAISIGTNTIQYTSFDSSFSHIYMFFLISLLLFIGQNFFNKPNQMKLRYLSIVLGLIAISRPTSIIALIGLPLVCTKKNQLKDVLQFSFQNLSYFIIPTISFIAIVFLQFLVTHLQLGSWKLWTYGEEGFNFLHPEFYQFLFGYRKGLFVYSPVLIISLLGIYFLWKKSKQKAMLFLTTFFLVSYILSSWWCWWFGGGFGSRAFIDFYPIMVIPMAYFFHNTLKTVSSYIVIPITGLLILLSLVFQYQYRYDIITWDGMNKEKFWQVFLETDRAMRWSTSTYPSRINDIDKSKSSYFFCDFDQACSPYFTKQKKLDLINVNTDNGIVRLIDENEIFGAPFKIAASALQYFEKNLLITIDCKLQIAKKTSSAVVVCTVEGKKEAWQSQNVNREIRKENTWQKGHFEFQLKDLLLATDTLNIYILNNSESPIWVDDLSIGIHTFEEK